MSGFPGAGYHGGGGGSGGGSGYSGQPGQPQYGSYPYPYGFLYLPYMSAGFVSNSLIAVRNNQPMPATRRANRPLPRATDINMPHLSLLTAGSNRCVVFPGGFSLEDSYSDVLSTSRRLRTMVHTMDHLKATITELVRRTSSHRNDEPPLNCHRSSYPELECLCPGPP